MGPGEIEGHLLSIAGDTDGVLHTVDTWDSKESADRFTAERLFPAFEKLGYSPGPGATHIGIEDADVVITGLSIQRLSPRHSSGLLRRVTGCRRMPLTSTFAIM